MLREELDESMSQDPSISDLPGGEGGNPGGPCPAKPRLEEEEEGGGLSGRGRGSGRSRGLDVMWGVSGGRMGLEGVGAQVV